MQRKASNPNQRDPTRLGKRTPRRIVPRREISSISYDGDLIYVVPKALSTFKPFTAYEWHWTEKSLVATVWRSYGGRNLYE